MPTKNAVDDLIDKEFDSEEEKEVMLLHVNVALVKEAEFEVTDGVTGLACFEASNLSIGKYFIEVS